jgi:hypothetical protein
MDQAVMVFDDATERDTALGTAVVSEGMVSYLKDVDALEVYTDEWVNVLSAAAPSYRFVSTVYFTSSGSFVKADYPWLKAVRVLVQGAGGGGRGTAATANEGQAGGAGGGYAEKFITDIAALDSSVTVTVGAGGTTAANADGNNGGNSSAFGLTGDGGGGAGAFRSGVGGSSSGGDLNIDGSDGGNAATGSGFAEQDPGDGGASVFAGLSNLVINNLGVNQSLAGKNGKNYGGGGSGAACRGTSGTARAGGVGAPGIVIVELYA